MSIEPVIAQSSGEEVSASSPFPNPWWGRVIYGLFITVLPILSFSLVELLKPDWQTGRLSAYLIMFLLPKASWLFFPLLAYSIVCYLLFLFAPTRFSDSFIVRCGIYTGTLLALQYSILELIYAFDSSTYIVILVWILPFLSSMIYRWSAARWTSQNVNRFLLILIPVTILIASLITRGSAALLILILLVMAAPFWSFLLGVQASSWLLKDYEDRLKFPRSFGLAAWIAGYIVAWRFDIIKMYELYAALPTQPPPDCYIATAAAQGHPQIVGSREVMHPNGRARRVNKQLQILKCAELALLAVHPHFHKFLRRIYDKVGKWLAPRIRHPYLADLAYLLLKPWEWLGGFLLRMIIPEIDSISNKMYTY